MKISATLLYTCALLSAVYAQQGGKKTPFSCPSQGFHADPRSCTVFYRCFDARSNYHLRNSYYPVSPKLYAYKFRCSEGTVFEPLENSCVPASKSSRYECRDSVLSRQRKDPTGSCEQEGFFGVYGECRKFYRCVGTGTGKYIKYDFECGTGTVWDTDNNVCNHAWATRRSDCGQQQTASGSDPSQSGSGSQSSNGHTTQRPESQTSQSTYTSRPTTSSTSRPTTYTTSRPTTYMTSRQTFQTSDTAQQTATTTTTTHPDYGPLEPDPETNEIQTSDNAPSQTCQSEGFFPTRGDCKKFYRCVSSGNAAYIRYDFECGEGTYWDAENNVCNHKYAVRRNCDDVGESAASSTTASAATTSSESESTTQSSTAAQEVSTTSSEIDQGSPIGSSTTTSNEQTSSTGSTVPSSSSTSDQEISGNDIVTSSTVSTTTEKQTSGSGGTTTSTSTTVGIQQTSDPSVSTATTEFTSVSEGASTSSSTSQSTENPSSVAESTTSATAQQNSSSNNSAPCNNQTQSQAAEISCPSAGYYPHPSDCKKFYRCVDWDGDKGQRFSVYHFDCPEGTIFDPALDVCNHEESVYPKRQCATPAKNSTEQTTQKTESTTSSSETTTQSSATENTTPPIGESETGTAGHASTTVETTITTEVAGNETVTSDQDSSTIIHTTDGSDHTTTPVGTTSATADTTAVTDHITMAATTTSDTDDTTTPANHPTTGESTNPSEHTTLSETTSATDHTTAAETTSVTEHTTSAETTRVTGHTTVAETTSVNDQSTVAGNEHTTQAQTEHTTQAETEHTTQAGTEHTTQSETEHTTQAETEHTTQSETEHTTQAETEHTTQAETEHTTQAGTEHTTQSETEHTTQAETTKITEHTTEAETTSTSESSTTPAGNTTGIQQCEVADLEEDQIVLVCPTGFRRHPKNCQLFYQCTTSSNNEIKVLVLSCPNNTVFDEKKIQCLPPEEAASCNSRSRSKRTIEGVTMADEGEICPSEGHYPYHQDCLKFFKCRKSRHGRMQGYLYQCPRGYAYWDVSKRCEKMHKIPSCASRDILPDVPVESKEIGSRSLSLEL